MGDQVGAATRLDPSGVSASPRILILDDEATIQVVLSEALETLDAEIAVVSSIGEAEACLLADPFDVAIIDKNLPDGNGIDFIKKFKTANPHGEAILMTGYSSLASAIDSIHSGVFDYITKPFQDIVLVAERVGEGLKAALQRKRRALVIQSAYRMQALGHLAASVGHEINNPLTYVLANASFLKDRLASPSAIQPEEMAKIIDEVVSGAEKIALVVRDLQVMGRREEEDADGVFEPAKTVREAIRLLDNQVSHNATIDVEISDCPSVFGSEMRLFQVLVNTIVNANQALEVGRSDNRIDIRVNSDEHGWARIQVEDNGSGIDPSVKDRVFDRFFTTKPVGEGTGLGLNISKRYVESMGGRIEASDAAERGTIFTISLPAHTDEVSEVASTGAADLVEPEWHASVLVIDDDDLVLRAMARILRNCEVRCVNSGDLALELLNKGEDFDVILCDIMMPGMDGVGVYRAVEKARPECLESIIFMTGGVFSQGAQALLSAIPNTCLNKPLAPLDLRRAIRSLLPTDPS